MTHNANRILALVLALVMALALTACGSKAEEKPADTNAPAATEEAPAEESAEEPAAEEEAPAEEAATEDPYADPYAAADPYADPYANNDPYADPYANNDPYAQQTDAEAEVSEKNITLTVTYADESVEEYAIVTDAEFLMDAIADTVELTGDESEYGFFVTGVNGVEADYDADGAYWAIYVNGDYGMYGVDSQPVADGDAFALTYTIG